MGSSRSRSATPIGEDFLQRYAAHIEQERGLAPSTVAYYVALARPFVAEFSGRGGDFAGLDAGHVSRFVVRECPQLSVGSAKLLVTALRSLLRYLHVTGITASLLTGAVPAVAGWRGASLPRDVDARTLRRVLESCDRRTAAGRRDYAVLLLLARLGLRRIEVARLRLEDVDWRRGELLVRGKGGQADSLPLPADVGKALAAFVRRGRPKTTSRSIFLCVKGRERPLSPGNIAQIVRASCARAEVSPVFGPHRLRHTAACQMLQRGTPLAEVALVLRHRSTLTTSIYAKVDRRVLNALARPWPHAAPVHRSSLRGVAHRWVGGDA